jgi:hypothetical protein
MQAAANGLGHPGFHVTLSVSDFSSNLLRLPTVSIHWQAAGYQATSTSLSGDSDDIWVRP